jgi:hypothetical protein
MDRGLSSPLAAWIVTLTASGAEAPRSMKRRFSWSDCPQHYRVIQKLFDSPGASSIASIPNVAHSPANSS